MFEDIEQQYTVKHSILVRYIQNGPASDTSALVVEVNPIDPEPFGLEFLDKDTFAAPWGDRQVDFLHPTAFQIESKDWEATIEIERNDVEDEQLGLYNPIVAALAQEAKRHPAKLIAGLLKTGAATACYDGKNFFAADHPVGSGTSSNYSSGIETGWFLLDTTRALKPFIFQLRRGVQLVRMDRSDDEQVFMRKKFRYGVDYRGTAAYGLWQLAYCSTQELNATNYAAARAAMMSLVNAGGAPLGVRPTLLVVFFFQIREQFDSLDLKHLEKLKEGE